MTAQKAKLKKTYQTAEKEAIEADKQLRNIRQYLGLERDTQEAVSYTQLRAHEKRSYNS